MGINGINPYNFSSNMRINDIPKVDINQPQVDKEAQKNEPKTQSLVIEPIEDKRPRALNPNEVSLTANKQEEFGYIGKERDVERLDMQKAISDMRQDSVLQDYQYFVGSSNNVFSSEDGMVIAKF